MKPSLFKLALLLLVGILASPLAQAQQPAHYRLTLQDAIQKALQANLNVLVAGTRVLASTRKFTPIFRIAIFAHSASLCRVCPFQTWSGRSQTTTFAFTRSRM